MIFISIFLCFYGYVCVFFVRFQKFNHLFSFQ